MARKWTNQDMPGALFFVTFNVHNRRPIFKDEQYCRAFLTQLQDLRRSSALLLIAFVLMPDHVHIVFNPAQGKVKSAMTNLKSLSGKRFIELAPIDYFRTTCGENQVWQESFHSLPLWSGWMVRQKINYLHANPVVAKLCATAEEYPWSSFRSFYREEADPLLQVDKEWWREGDLELLEASVEQWENSRGGQLRALIESHRAKLRRG